MRIELDDKAVRQAIADYTRKEHVAPKSRKEAEVEVESVTRHQGGAASAVVVVTNA